MTAPLPPIFDATFAALALAIVAATGMALWWLLHRESRTTLLVLAVTTSLSLAVRLFYTTDYPRGLNEDEPKVLYAAGKAVERGTLLAESNISVPILQHALFHGQLIPLLGPGRWSIRAYDLVCGVLATPAAFAAARALGMGVASSLSVGAFIAVLPWSIFYSRVMQGASLTLYELLLIAALGLLIWQRGGWRAGLIGGGALAWLLYGYWCTRAALPLPIVAAVLARGRARLWCVAVLLIGMGLYRPYVEANRNSMFISQGVINPAQFASAEELSRLLQRTRETLTSFVAPVADNGWLTVRAAALHPWTVLALAAVGSLAAIRRGLFLWAGFALGIVPTVLAWGPPSTHRMLMAFPFIALAAGSALDLLRPPRLRHVAVAAAVLAVGWSSLRFYFSDDFWSTETRWRFDAQRTEVIDSLPIDPPQPVIMMRQITFFRDPRRLVTANDQELTVDNWLPDARGAIYVFTSEAIELRPFYEHLFGATRVQSFGWTFTATLEPRDWSFLRQHGWTYSARCEAIEKVGHVPVLYHSDVGFADFACNGPTIHRWHGRWLGAAATLRLRSFTPATIETPRGSVPSYKLGQDEIVDLQVEPGDELTVTVTTLPFHGHVSAALMEVTPLGERVPDWERVEPLPAAGEDAKG